MFKELLGHLLVGRFHCPEASRRPDPPVLDTGKLDVREARQHAVTHRRANGVVNGAAWGHGLVEGPGLERNGSPCSAFPVARVALVARIGGMESDKEAGLGDTGPKWIELGQEGERVPRVP